MDDLLSEFLTETSESLEVLDVELVEFPTFNGVCGHVVDTHQQQFAALIPTHDKPSWGLVERAKLQPPLIESDRTATRIDLLGQGHEVVTTSNHDESLCHLKGSAGAPERRAFFVVTRVLHCPLKTTECRDARRVSVGQPIRKALT